MTGGQGAGMAYAGLQLSAPSPCAAALLHGCTSATHLVGWVKVVGGCTRRRMGRQIVPSRRHQQLIAVVLAGRVFIPCPLVVRIGGSSFRTTGDPGNVTYVEVSLGLLNWFLVHLHSRRFF